MNNFIIFESFRVHLIPACIAASAYFFLIFLNLSSPEIQPKKRFAAILFSFAILLSLNILRIIAMVLIFIYGKNYFDITHKIFWYGLSTIFVLGIWFLEVYLFKIKSIPIYSDIKFLINQIRK